MKTNLTPDQKRCIAAIKRGEVVLYGPITITAALIVGQGQKCHLGGRITVMSSTLEGLTLVFD